MERVPSELYNRPMPACKACFHPDRAEIDRQIVAGTPFRVLVASTGLSLGALHRHKRHVKEMLAEAMALRAGERSEHGADLLNRCESLFTQTEEILTTCKADKNFKGAVAAVGALTRVLELLAKLRGELSPSGGVHLSFTSNKLTINQNAGSDEELAMLIQEATDNFSEATIARLKALAESAESAITKP